MMEFKSKGHSLQPERKGLYYVPGNIEPFSLCWKVANIINIKYIVHVVRLDKQSCIGRCRGKWAVLKKSFGEMQDIL